MDEHLTMRALESCDAPELARLLDEQSEAYTRLFKPFAFEQTVIEKLLTNRRRDVYEGLFRDHRLIGFFMLRGWDENFDVPSYGVLIDEEYRNLGLAKLTLRTAKTICRLRRCTHMMLKVHPENTLAKRLYEQAGFICVGVDPANDNLIYRTDINARSAKF